MAPAIKEGASAYRIGFAQRALQFVQAHGLLQVQVEPAASAWRTSSGWP